MSLSDRKSLKVCNVTPSRMPMPHCWYEPGHAGPHSWAVGGGGAKWTESAAWIDMQARSGLPKHLCPECKTPRIMAPKQRDGWTCRCRQAKYLMAQMERHRG